MPLADSSAFPHGAVFLLGNVVEIDGGGPGEVGGIVIPATASYPPIFGASAGPPHTAALLPELTGTKLIVTSFPPFSRRKDGVFIGTGAATGAAAEPTDFPIRFMLPAMT